MYYVEETTYGTTPATPALKTLRHTGTSLGLSKGTNMSEELRSDRQIEDYRHGAKQTGGDISTEVSYGTLDDLLEAVLCGEWSAGAGATITGTTISAAAADDSFNDSGNGFITAGFSVGDRITVSGFTGTVANNDTYIIQTVAAGKITVILATGAAAANIVDDAAGESVTIAKGGNTLKAGVERRSFSVIRNFTDQVEADDPFHRFTGVELNTVEVNVTAEAIVTATFGTVGRELVVEGEDPAGATYPAVGTTRVMDAFTGAPREGGTTIGVITEINFTLDNGIEPRFVVGSDLTIRPSIKRSNLSGTATMYFENATMMNKFINETETSIDLTIRDAAGNRLRFFMPRVKYNGGQPDVDDEGPVTLSMPFQALRDSTTGSNIIIDRIAA